MKKIEDIVQNLLMYGWAIFNMRDILPHIDPVLTGFKELISREEEYTEKWKFHYQNLSLKADHGLLPPKGEGFDQKHLLMWRRNLKSELLASRFSYEEIAPYVPMLDNLGGIFKKSYSTILQIATEFDRQTDSLYRLYQHINKKSLMDVHSLRLPEYLYDPMAPVRRYSAGTHVDLGILTMQMIETEHGLIIQGYDGKLVEYKYCAEEGTVIVFPGDKMTQLTDGRYLATPHAVLAKALRNRNSLMLFAHTEHPTREMDKRHSYPKFEEAVEKKYGSLLQAA
jgi:hypothetical protein